MAVIAPLRRVRRTPLSDGAQVVGVKANTVYNHMLLPVVCKNAEADAVHLKEHVQVWDVSVERQVSIKGPCRPEGAVGKRSAASDPFRGDWRRRNTQLHPWLAR